MTGLGELEQRAGRECLSVLGAFHAEPGDALPDGTGTLILLGPAEPGFWAHVTAQPEWSDTRPDPLDRWSARVIGAIAAKMGGVALFPFGGPPWQPFYNWALRSGRAWASPVSILVHDTAGLLVSYRGAIALPQRISLPAPPISSPCLTCREQPCKTACPTAALTGQGYDVPLCHAFLDTNPGADCLSAGCSVRRACPVSRAYGRLPEQSAYHMRLFHT